MKKPSISNLKYILITKQARPVPDLHGDKQNEHHALSREARPSPLLAAKRALHPSDAVFFITAHDARLNAKSNKCAYSQN